MSMNEKVIHTNAVLNMFNSLQKAVQQAGGAYIEMSELSRMSALDLMYSLAPNDIRFVCYHEDDNEELPGDKRP